MSEQTRVSDALAAAARELATAARGARNINRLRGQAGRTPRDAVNLDNLLAALQHIHDITGHLAKTVTQYAHAVRTPLAGYAGARTTPDESPADYPRAVATAAAAAEQTLLGLANKLGYGAPVSHSIDAIAGLDIAVHNWRVKHRHTTRS